MSVRGRRWMPFRLVWEARDRHPWAGPLAAAGIAAGAVMAVFGLPPVDLHGPLHYVGVMGPLCGGTRGVHAVMLGHLDEAWRYNPLSPVLVAGAAGAVVREVVGRVSGRWLNLRVTRRRIAIVIGLLLVVALTVNQQAHADRLRTGPEGGMPTELLLYVATVPLAAIAVAAMAVVRLRSRRHPGRG
ncbi:DUF2752 domain-containing protein [Streptomyces gobiensis]|uniref:DUF2752 domain-containing protein n=1 Tax=Streptomyces gobiensis TaxID=2875706 RepID=UPI001E60D74E|nr:DUF2752 domain-containing protein [Streptomyces gobiensis]UGY91002.1 DUF2752 domain-containing protein [Streptomyces gobiensis]